MIELPEALLLSKQLNFTVTGKTVQAVFPPTKPHKFCWFAGDPIDYSEQVIGSKITSAEGFGIYVDLIFDNGKKLSLNDGVNIRFLKCGEKQPKDYQLKIEFSDGDSLVFTVAMYGGIILHCGDYDNQYYVKSQQYVSPFSNRFKEHYYELLNKSKQTLSGKAFIATEQRFPGIGNGCCQDILFASGIHPKRKISTLSSDDKEKLLLSIISVLGEMTDNNGRDTEKDIFGKEGNYKTKMSKNALNNWGCIACGGSITKETFLGGSIYFCQRCQPFIKE